MPKQKTIAELNAEKEKIEQQLTQEQHKKQRLENRIAYYERGDRTKRAHNLIVRSADMESIAPLTKLLTRAEFYAFAEKVFDLPEVKGLLMEAVNEYIKKIIIHAPDKSGGKRRQKVEIIFNFVDEVEIPVLAEPMIAESTLGRKKTA